MNSCIYFIFCTIPSSTVVEGAVRSALPVVAEEEKPAEVVADAAAVVESEKPVEVVKEATVVPAVKTVAEVILGRLNFIDFGLLSRGRR